MDFFAALVRYEIDLWNTLDDALRKRGRISLAQLQAVGIIAAHAGRGRVNDISEEIGMTVGAASKLVDRLERDGLAVRGPNPADRRSSLITLTTAGERALRDAATVRDSLLRAVVDDRQGQVALEAIATLQTRLNAYRKDAAA